MPYWPDTTLEHKLWGRGFAYIAGIDEAGRGAWAGPVVAACVVLPRNPKALAGLSLVRDSKSLSARQREICFEAIQSCAWGISIGRASVTEVDTFGILPATRLAMRRAIDQLSLQPEYLLIDAVPLPHVPVPQQAIIKGDRSCLSIAAASIIAKVARDRWMVQLDRRFPVYGFAQHKGYGTRQHRTALEAFGPTPYHRFSFAPIRNLRKSSLLTAI